MIKMKNNFSIVNHFFLVVFMQKVTSLCYMFFSLFIISNRVNLD